MKATRKAKRTSPSNVWKGRIPADVLAKVRELAFIEDRKVNVTLVRLLKEALNAHGLYGQLQPDLTRLVVAPPILPVVPSSAPPRRIQQMADAKKKVAAPAIPDEIAQKILEDEQGWEGSDPATLLAGTKVKI